MSTGQNSERLEALDQEWDIERAIEVNASVLAFTGAVLKRGEIGFDSLHF
jgi:hypothetical protein